MGRTPFLFRGDGGQEPHQDRGDLGPGGGAAGLEAVVLKPLEEALGHRPGEGFRGVILNVPGIREAIASGREDIPAKVIRKNGDVADLLLHVRGLTADEKEIILDGCLMNYYAKRAE